MKNVSTKLVPALITILTLFLFPEAVFAQQIENPVAFDNITDIISAYVGIFRLVVTLLFIGVLMYGGFTYLTAGAEEEKVANAKKIIGAGIGGFIIIALAPAIVQFVGALIGVDGGLLNN